MTRKVEGEWPLVPRITAVLKQVPWPSCFPQIFWATMLHRWWIETHGLEELVEQSGKSAEDPQMGGSAHTHVQLSVLEELLCFGIEHFFFSLSKRTVWMCVGIRP